MSTREELIEAFLREAGWESATRRLLAADASFRTYFRLQRGPRRLVLMDAPPPQEDVRPFIHMTRLLEGLGLSAPHIYAQNIEAGLLLIDDFGDDTYPRLLAAGVDEAPLYELAVDALIVLHQRYRPGHGFTPPPYDEARFLTEARLLTDWYLPAVSGKKDFAHRSEYLELWRRLLPKGGAVPRTLVLRDYIAANLMRLSDRPGIGACGLLDFQDAVIGPVTYDLVSLLKDGRRDVSPEIKAALTERYLRAFPELDRDSFASSCAVLGAQRNCKIIGIFTRLWRRDGKPGYLPHLPRLWRLLEADLAHPDLAPMKEFLDHHVPPEWRRGLP
ncbi:MAG TPA: phosphotransferase [Stellaceae bacterium]|nr:phosphotransferase [Stellaceae bacterium]